MMVFLVPSLIEEAHAMIDAKVFPPDLFSMSNTNWNRDYTAKAKL